MNIEDLYSMKENVCVITGESSGLGSYMTQGFLAAGAFDRLVDGAWPRNTAD